jgi:hypothetical protein
MDMKLKSSPGSFLQQVSGYHTSASQNYWAANFNSLPRLQSPDFIKIGVSGIKKAESKFGLFG